MPQAKQKNIKSQPMTREQQLAAISRGFTQQFQSIAQGALFNLLNNSSSFGTAISEPGAIVDASIKIASDFMEKISPAVNAAFNKMMNRPIPEAEEAK